MAIKERGNKLLKLIDRMVGIPLVLLLSVFKVRRSASHRSIAVGDAKRIALFKSAAIGDTVILSASVADIRDINSKVHLTIFTGSSNYEIARLIPGVDEVVKLPVTRPLEAIQILRNTERFDIWVDFGSWPRLDALFSWVAPANFSIGFKTVGQYRHYLYDLAIPHLGDIHEHQNYKNLLNPLNVLGINTPRLIGKHAEESREQKRVVIHMFPGGSKAHLKQWPEDKWIQLIGILVARGCEVILTGGESEYDQLTQIKHQAGNSDLIQVVAGKLSISETAGLLETAIVVISVDTGVMHMASALKCNLIALHGPTSPSRWGALNSNSISIVHQLPCSPCISLGFESSCSNNLCMSYITVDDITGAINKLQVQNGKK